MASTLPTTGSQAQLDETGLSGTSDWSEAVPRVMLRLASLKITVALFGLSIFLVLAGTLAQTEMDIWDVVHGYFRSPIAWIRPGVFFPESFAPGGIGSFFRQLPFSIPFPGGWLIGACMVVNLVAAHTARFKIQASGARLHAGLATLVLGVFVTWLVIASGANKEGIQGATLIPYSTLWFLFKIGVAGLFAASLYFTAVLWTDKTVPAWARKLIVPVPLLLGGLVLWMLTSGSSFELGDSSMRILWQLIKGTIAGVVLLAGCFLVFNKRAGIVLLHGGVGLMMFSEVLVGLTAIEGQMQIDEGQTVNYVQDIRDYELAVIDASDDATDRMTIVPASRLRKSIGKVIQDEQLPFDIKVEKYYANSRLRKPAAEDKNPADTGAGTEWFVEEVKGSVGTDNKGGVDQPAAYLTLLKKGTEEKLGTVLASLALGAEGLKEPVSVDDKNFGVTLRFKREYKPYSMTLLDVRKDDYQGTSTPRNYSSDVLLVDETRDTNRPVHIWMNNPLRFAGETFYQSSYFKNPRTGEETTTLSVVTNTGWMIPYVSCMIVAVGMLFQFGATLLRFLNRRSGISEGASLATPASELSLAVASGKLSQHSGRPSPVAGLQPASEDARPAGDQKRAAIILSIAVVLIFGGYVLSKARVPKAKAGEMKLQEFGQLPVVFEGRTKPVDTIARNAMLILSNRQTWTDENGRSQPAIAWMLDVIARPERSFHHRVVRIDNIELQEWLGLEKRKGFRYSMNEFMKKMPELDKLANEARELGDKRPTEVSTFQRKAVELQTKLRQIITIRRAFEGSLPDEVKQVLGAPMVRTNPEMKQRLRTVFTEELYKFGAPRMVPPVSGDQWDVYAATAFDEVASPATVNPAHVWLKKMFDAYASSQPREFNSALASYQTYLAEQGPESLDQSRMRFEAFFNHFSPFWYSAGLYLVAFVLAACALLGWSVPLNRASFWLIAFTLCLHTFALVGRMYISGRPPVTNLYSSAVFIGWGCVALGMVMEVIYRLGIGNILAAVSGFLTLGIAHFLAGDGDTFTVLQAVLDTQFWLATHVVCITLGYATTFVAGILGLLYLIQYNRFGLLALGAGLAPVSLVLIASHAFDYSETVGAVVGLAAAGCILYWALNFTGDGTRTIDANRMKSMPRMIYGTLCFAIFFSFVGTVLGGLWADDSWGRFWGWDPKENGALIIVLWNALVLHARWGGMVRDRGMAVLSIAGNICTSWSWFGVNELGVGLHSYGFTDGVLLALGLFALSQFLFIAAGSLPEKFWLNSKQAAG